jgi:hypothetical protein
MGTHSSAPAPSQAGGSFEGQRESLFASLQRHVPVPTRAPAAAPSPLTFAECARLGYGQRLVPIIPPDAPISERSSLFKRVGTDQDGRGKTPGVRGRDGNWYGFDWLAYEADKRDLERWAAISAGVGIKTGNGLVLIDADTLNEAHAAIIAETVEQHFGRLPLRIGRSPKAGYLLRVSEPVRYQRVEFGALNAKGRPGDRVEILSDGRQFVAHGVHPRTGRPYFWPRPLVPFEALPVASASQITAFLEELRTLLPASKPIITEGAPSAVNQEALKGRPEIVAKAVRAIPNTSAHFPTRESYRDFGYAIKAALPDHEAEAFDLFSDWCARWDDGENDPDVVEADWRRMKPPFRRGAGWLYELAEQHAPEQFSRAEQWFEQPPPPHESLFGESSSAAADRKPRTLELVSFDTAAGTALTTSAEPLIEGLLDQGALSVMYAPSNAGKTFVMLDMSDAVATGRQWCGKRTARTGVLYVAAEGGRGVRKRCAAIAKKYPGERGDFFQLRLASIDLLHPNQDLEPLIETVRQSPARIGLIVIDTFSRALAGGNENDSVDMGVMVRHLDKIKEATGARTLRCCITPERTRRGARAAIRCCKLPSTRKSKSRTTR